MYWRFLSQQSIQQAWRLGNMNISCPSALDRRTTLASTRYFFLIASNHQNNKDIAGINGIGDSALDVFLFIGYRSQDLKMVDRWIPDWLVSFCNLSDGAEWMMMCAWLVRAARRCILEMGAALDGNQWLRSVEELRCYEIPSTCLRAYLKLYLISQWRFRSKGYVQYQYRYDNKKNAQ